MMLSGSGGDELEIKSETTVKWMVGLCIASDRLRGEIGV